MRAFGIIWVAYRTDNAYAAGVDHVEAGRHRDRLRGIDGRVQHHFTDRSTDAAANARLEIQTGAGQIAARVKDLGKLPDIQAASLQLRPHHLAARFIMSCKRRALPAQG